MPHCELLSPEELQGELRMQPLIGFPDPGEVRLQCHGELGRTVHHIQHGWHHSKVSFIPGEACWMLSCIAWASDQTFASAAKSNTCMYPQPCVNHCCAYLRKNLLVYGLHASS